MKKLWSIAVILILAFFLSACSSNSSIAQEESNDGTPESTENTEVKEDAETEDSVTFSGTAVNSLALVEKISAEWAQSGHANTGRPLNYAGGRDGCQPCHSGNGFQQHLTEEPYTPEADAEASGETAALPTTMDCATCHTGAGKEMLLTGITEGYVPFMKESYDAGKGSALCISCHNGRRDTGSIYEEWASGEGKPTEYPHYDSGALYSGKGGMEYPDVEYRSSVGHQIEGCTSCHMPETEDGYVSHDFAMNLEYIDVTCDSCHGDIKDYSVGGNLQAELDELLKELEKELLAAVDGAAEIGTGHGTFPFLDENGEVIDIENVSLEAFVGAYNYVLIKKDKSGGAHNPRYAKSLLEESLYKLQ